MDTKNTTITFGQANQLLKDAMGEQMNTNDNEIAQLKAEIEDLKKADEYSQSLCEIQNEKFMDQLEGKDEEIAELKKKLEEQRLEGIKNANKVYLLKGFLKGQIQNKLEKDVNDSVGCYDSGNITISSYGYLGQFYEEKLQQEVISECIQEMTTYESGGNGYRNGYWYDENGSRYNLIHDLKKGNEVCWTEEPFTSDEEDSDED
tara:strand:- start:42 stop:653 length:612 start_codon:yes stop_codon:yes gene_type:complete